jgi:hypothetical protein
MLHKELLTVKIILEHMSSPLTCKNVSHKWQVHAEEVYVPESSNAEFASLKKDVPHSLPMSPHVTQAAGTAC